MSDDERPPQDSPAEDAATPIGIVFTAERLAFLQPRLQQLLADLRALDVLVPASTEPAFTSLTYDEGGSDAD